MRTATTMATTTICTPPCRPVPTATYIVTNRGGIRIARPHATTPTTTNGRLHQFL